MESLIDAGDALFWKCFNIFSADFGHRYPFLQCRLFTQYCCSFYGAPLWNVYIIITLALLGEKHLEKYETLYYLRVSL